MASDKVKKFMKESGYQNRCDEYLGVFKKGKRGQGCYRRPDEMLQDFIDWQVRERMRKS